MIKWNIQMYHKSRKYNLKLVNHVINDQGAFSIAFQCSYTGQCPRGYSLKWKLKYTILVFIHVLFSVKKNRYENIWFFFMYVWEENLLKKTQTRTTRYGSMNLLTWYQNIQIEICKSQLIFSTILSPTQSTHFYSLKTGSETRIFWQWG